MQLRLSRQVDYQRLPTTNLNPHFLSPLLSKHSSIHFKPDIKLLRSLNTFTTSSIIAHPVLVWSTKVPNEYISLPAHIRSKMPQVHRIGPLRSKISTTDHHVKSWAEIKDQDYKQLGNETRLQLPKGFKSTDHCNGQKSTNAVSPVYLYVQYSEIIV